MKIYVSIPITGHDYGQQQAKADQWASSIEALGHEALNPFDIGDEQADIAHIMGADITALLQCDAIFIPEAITASKGCRLERYAAELYGLKIYNNFNLIPHNIKN